MLDISLTVSPILDESGQVIGVSKIARDITDRKRSERELRESEARFRKAAGLAALAAEANAKFRAFFEQGKNFAGVLSLDGTVIEANRLCLDACGFTREEVLGRPFWECGWWSRSPELMEMVQTATRQAAEGRLFRTETNYYVADGSQRIVDLILAPVNDAEGRTLFVAATGTDVTDRRRMEDDLREQDRRKDEFLALLAHELRNPLAPLRNGLQVMRLANDDPAVVARTRAMMERQLKHLVRMIDDLIDVSRINRNRLQLRRSRTLFADVLKSAIETARPTIETREHKLSVSLPPEPVWLDADLTRLAQAFDNLLSNSARYTPQGGQIWLEATRHGKDLLVTVRDNGIGIPAESLPLVFDMFSQVQRGIEGASGGLGIGLAIVKKLVEMHGGEVTAESAGLEKGSTFTVRLPILESDPEPIIAGKTAGDLPGASSGWRVLVVEDNQDSATSLANVLDLLGNEVRIACDGIEAVQMAQRFAAELILMDLGMPRLNGYEATRRIRGLPGGDKPIIIALTGWGQEADRARSRDAGCDGHLVKPVEIHDIEKILTTLKNRPKAQHSLELR